MSLLQHFGLGHTAY